MTAEPAAGPVPTAPARDASRRLPWRTATVLDVRPETPRARRLVLDLPDRGPHLPGQHLDVRLRAPDGYTAQRSYSVASAPEAATVDLVVEALPDGEVSPYLTQELRPGDGLEVRGPVGGWFVWHAGLGGPLQLIAGGSGVVPFLSMLEHRAAGGAGEGRVPARLLYSARTLPDVIARDRLAELDVELTVVLTRQAPPGWPGPTGRIDAALLEQVAVPPEQAPHVFVCGPTGFVEAVAGVLVQLGHDPARIRTERYGSGGT